MSPRVRINANSIKPAMGGGMTNRRSPLCSVSTSRARSHRRSSVFSAWASVIPQILAALRMVKGRTGSWETALASSSV